MPRLGGTDSKLDDQIEDLKVVPEAAPKTEAEKTMEALILKAAGPVKAAGIVNNLNSFVKKKKPTPVPVASGSGSAAVSGSGGEKRKAEESNQGEDKKAKVDQ